MRYFRYYLNDCAREARERENNSRGCLLSGEKTF